MVDNDYFITEDNLGMLKLAKEANSILVIYRLNSLISSKRKIGNDLFNY